MTESQPKGSETTTDAMEEDLIEESAFEVEKGGRFTGMLCALSQLCEFVFKMAFAKLPFRHFWSVFSGKNLASMSRYYNTFSIFTNVNKRKAPASQSKSNKKAKKFSWSTEKVDVFLIF